MSGQGQGHPEGQIHLIGYNFSSNCHILVYEKPHPTMTLTLTFDLDLEKFTQGQNFWNISAKEN